MALRAARSAVKMGSPAVLRGRVIVVWVYPVGPAVAQDRCWWPVDRHHMHRGQHPGPQLAAARSDGVARAGQKLGSVRPVLARVPRLRYFAAVPRVPLQRAA
jgi:hypothetical protein